MNPLFLLLLLLAAFTAHARTVTDDYGRSVTLPDKVTRIYAASPPLTMSVIAFDPALVAALNMPFSEAQKTYVGAAAERPVAGGFFGQGNTPNFEVLAAARPDVILMWGKMTGSENALQKLSALNIPVLLVRNDSINDLSSQFALYGKITGNRSRAEELIAYTDETLGLINALQAELAKRKKVRYYFAEGIDGLSSECNGSFHLEPFSYAGGENALDCRMSSNFGMEKIALETIMLADPDVIVAMDKSFASNLQLNPQWKNLRAVQKHRVFTVPETPFNYITRPPSFMRLLGIRWLIHAFYPDLLNGSPAQEKQQFERLFFGIGKRS
ncbi:ABC transporter substrate-binding protein [bacterium]|nr:ABC transporter substrate-binding protein [bacterium]